jgi:hypothetical protein
MEQGCGTGQTSLTGGDNFDCATLVAQSKGMPKEGFKGQVERHLRGKEAELWEAFTSSYIRVGCLSLRKPSRRFASCWGATNLEVIDWR